jgi:hypothetical protein
MKKRWHIMKNREKEEKQWKTINKYGQIRKNNEK